MKSKRAFLFPGQWYQFVKMIGLPIRTATLFGSIFAATKRQHSSIFHYFPSYRVVYQSGWQWAPLILFQHIASGQNHNAGLPAGTHPFTPFMKK